MTALAKRLAMGIDVRCSTLAFAIHAATDGWRVALDDGTSLYADALVVTCPVPQSYSLLITAGVSLPADMLTGEYERTIALLACIDRPVSIGPFGAVQGDPVFSMIADNMSKGVSVEPAVTFHASPVWSREHWDEPHVATHLALVGEAERFLHGARVTDSQMKRWRFATPTMIWPDRCWIADTPAPLALAGDAFGGPKVEGAYLSGLAAAAAVLAGAARQ